MSTWDIPEEVIEGWEPYAWPELTFGDPLAELQQLVRGLMLDILANLAPGLFQGYDPAIPAGATPTIDGNIDGGMYPAVDGGNPNLGIDGSVAGDTVPDPPPAEPPALFKVITPRVAGHTDIQQIGDSSANVVPGATLRNVWKPTETGWPQVNEIGKATRLSDGTVVWWPLGAYPVAYRVTSVDNGTYTVKRVQDADSEVAGTEISNVYSVGGTLFVGDEVIIVRRGDTEIGAFAGAVGLHAAAHIRAGADEIDGDKLDLDWNPTNYTPAATPAEADHVDNLTAHLYGIDQALSAAISHTLDGTPHSDVAAITEAQGQVLYQDGTDWQALGPGTSGYFLKTQGAAANPVWASAWDYTNFAGYDAGKTQVLTHVSGTLTWKDTTEC